MLHHASPAHDALRCLKIVARRQPVAKGSRAAVRASPPGGGKLVCCARGRAHARADLAAGPADARETSVLGLRLQKSALGVD
eukprot:4453083-Pyramimonas_sp.AAC.1